MKKIILIPAYKPDATMTDLVSSLHSRGFSVVVVDDGSGAEYAAMFEKAKPFADVVGVEKNGGKGAAIKKGLTYISEHFASPFTVVTADADGQHSVEDIINVAELAQQSPDALVLGCRTISRDIPLRNWLGNVYTKAVFRLSTGRSITDTQTGLRGFSDKTIPFMLAQKGSRYEYEMNVLLWWVRGGMPVKEVPIRTLYFEGGVSHFKAIRDSVIIYWQIIKFSLPSYIGFFADVALFALLWFVLPFGFFTRLLAANIGARLISAPVHFLWLYFASRRFPDYNLPSAKRYFSLAAAIIAVNTLMLWGLMSLGAAATVAKIIVNVIMYLLTVFVQWRFFYKDKR